MAELPPAEAERLLAAPPAAPADITRFSSSSAAVGPGIYDGPPMVPARGPEPSEADRRRQMLECSRDPGAAERWFDADDLRAKVPEPGPRAAVSLLSGTVAEGLLPKLVGDEAITSLRYGTPATASRILGHGASTETRLVNDRYRNEHCALLAGAVAHELLADPVPRCDAEEKVTHAVLAMVQMQLLSSAPQLAELGTELARRVHSIVLSLFNSRSPGDPRFRIIAPDGPGTIPGGIPAMQSPDFWSIPFLSGHPLPAPIPESFRTVLVALGCDWATAAEPLHYELATVRRIDDTMDDRWLTMADRIVVGRALTVL